MELSNANLKSILVHTWILFLWAIMIMMPDISNYLSTVMDPKLAALLVMWISIVIKKLLNSK